jgi:hypothetical protein
MGIIYRLAKCPACPFNLDILKAESKRRWRKPESGLRHFYWAEKRSGAKDAGVVEKAGERARKAGLSTVLPLSSGRGSSGRDDKAMFPTYMKAKL